jgi:hypothetical protein
MNFIVANNFAVLEIIDGSLQSSERRLQCFVCSRKEEIPTLILPEMLFWKFLSQLRMAYSLCRKFYPVEI